MMILNLDRQINLMVFNKSTTWEILISKSSLCHQLYQSKSTQLDRSLAQPPSDIYSSFLQKAVFCFHNIYTKFNFRQSRILLRTSLHNKPSLYCTGKSHFHCLRIHIVSSFPKFIHLFKVFPQFCLQKVFGFNFDYFIIIF